MVSAPAAANSEKYVAKGITRSNIFRFKHENNIRMYNEAKANKVVNRRIASKLHQVRAS